MGMPKPSEEFSKQALTKEVRQLLLREVPVASEEGPDWEALHSLLRQWVTEQLEYDPSRLRLVLYRVDVDESRAAEALSLGDTKAIADALASLILERQAAKARWRIWYRNRK